MKIRSWLKMDGNTELQVLRSIKMPHKNLH